MAKGTKSDDAHYLMLEWAKHRNNTPSYDKESKAAAVRAAFGSKPPPNVWFTPLGMLREFQRMNDIYNHMPDYQRLAVKRLYLDEIPPVHSASVLGISEDTLERYRLQGSRIFLALLERERKEDQRRTLVHPNAQAERRGSAATEC